jgi:hypothetical protein
LAPWVVQLLLPFNDRLLPLNETAVAVMLSAPVICRLFLRAS